MQSKRPTFKPEINIPVTISFLTLPSESKEYANDFDPTKPQHLYFIMVLDTKSGTEVEHAWFATDKQHHELLQKGVQLNRTYEIVSRKQGSDKYPTFIVKDVHSDGSALTPDEHAVLEKVDEIFGKGESSVASKKTLVPEAAAWALGKALDSLGPNATDEQLLEFSERILKLQSKLRTTYQE